jgi:hypothetical protein
MRAAWKVILAANIPDNKSTKRVWEFPATQVNNFNRKQESTSKLQLQNTMCTLIKKENQTFLIYKEIQMGSGAKSYMRKGFLIYEEMRKFFPIYEKAVSHI